MGQSIARTATAIVAAAAVALANSDLYCYTTPERGTDNVVSYSVGAATVHTTALSASCLVEWCTVSCYVYYNYVATDEHGHPVTTTWDSPRTAQMTRSTAQLGNTYSATLPLRNNSALEVVSYCVHGTQQFWCGGSVGNIAFRMPPVVHRNATRPPSFRVHISPAPGSDTVVEASTGSAVLTTTVEGNVNISCTECFAWYGYATASDRGVITAAAVQPLSMIMRLHAGNSFRARIPVVVGHVLQATAYCVSNDELVWATPAGTASFRLPLTQQHPTGTLVVLRNHSTPTGYSRFPRTDAIFSLHIASQFTGATACHTGTCPVAGARCLARFGYPTRFGGVWPTYNETTLSQSTTVGSVDHWTGAIPLPTAGRVLEATARCVYNGIESWLGASYQVASY
eukprot:m51a1_g6460 hypothetical protein (398) ;mRNA; f:20942-22317